MGTTNTKAVLIDADGGLIDRASIAAQPPQVGIEVPGSLVAFLLEKFQPEKSGKIIMSGGAARSSFWPQVIADLCELTVEAIHFPEFTAYGAAIHAKSAFEGKQSSTDQYQRWYTQHQKPMFEKLLTGNRK